MKCQKSFVLWCVLFAFVLSLGMVSQYAAASNATGQFTVNNNSVQFTHAYAIVQPDVFDETVEYVVVILADAPLSNEAVWDEWVRRDMTRDKGLKYVEFTINSEKQPSQFLFLLDPSEVSSNYKFVNEDIGRLELKVFDKENVEGRFYTDGEETFIDTYNFDFTFRAEIRRDKKAAALAERAEKLAALSPKEKFEQTLADMEMIVWALNYYRAEHDGWPSSPSEKDLSELGLDELYYINTGYEGDLKDAWGTPFKYVTVKDGKEFVLTSYGADNAKGDGTGKFDVDIVCENGRLVEPASVIEELYGE